MKSRAIFLDRDGTINELVYDSNHGIFDSPLNPEQLKVKPDAAYFVREVKTLGYKIIIVTNQPGIAKGTLSLENLKEINRRLLEAVGIDNIDDVYVCPHHPTGYLNEISEYVRECDCRKPEPGMILKAAERHNVDVSRSWMIGDGVADVQAGTAAGCKTMLVANIKVEHLARFLKNSIEPNVIVPTLRKALQELQQSNFFE